MQLSFPPDFPQLAKDFVTKILKKNPADRLNLVDMNNHIWI
jgi:hypothetical protein